METDNWGISFAYDLYGVDKSIINNPEQLRKWINEFVDFIDMKRWGEASIVWFGEKNSNKEGYTVVQLIETSCITAHFNSHPDKDGFCTGYIDVFTCKILDNLKEKIEKNLFDTFKPVNIKYTKILRNAQRNN